MCGGRWFDRSYDLRLMDEADEVVRAEERERRIEKTPVALPREEGYRPDPMHEQRLEAIWMVLKREMPGTASWVRGTAAYTPDERRRLCEEILAAAETAI